MKKKKKPNAGEAHHSYSIDVAGLQSVSEKATLWLCASLAKINAFGRMTSTQNHLLEPIYEL